SHPHDNNAIIVQQPQRFEYKLEKMIQHLLVVEDAHDRLRSSTYSPKHDAGLTLDDFLVGPSK
ncbi:hypothetical protein PMAYCL1PPCAC_32652, partial [Pristionchus mayeri]